MPSRLTVGTLAFLLVSLTRGLGAQTVSPLTITNAADPRIEIIPLDKAHLAMIPSILTNIPAQLPGSFILKNRTKTAITVVVARWSYTEKNGNVQKRGINCDGYVASPIWPVVKAQDISLIGPEGCIPRESFLQGAGGNAGVNNPIPSSGNIVQIELTLDSVIFEDGQILGPDRDHYYTTIWERYNAAQSVVSDIVAAKNSGEDIAAHLERIRNDARLARDRQSSWRGHYAALLQRSPNREGTLKQLQEQPAPPEFRHIGEQNQ